MDKPPGQTELRILLLEDVPTDAELTENALREAGLSFTARRVDTREAFILALEEFKPDIVLADYKLPAFDGGSALKIVRQQYPTVPVVMVTGAMGDEKAIELLKLGARDYVLKDRLARLGPAVRRTLSEEQGIRARKAAELALRQSEAELRALVEHSPIAMLVDVGVDANEKIVMMNQKFTELFGYTLADVPDMRHWWPLAYPDEKYREEIKAEWTRRAEKAIQSHTEIEPMEVTVTCKDGVNRYVRVSLASIGSKNIITFEDLTERKRLADALKEVADRNRAIMETANDAIICIKPDGTIYLWNHKAEELFGYTAEEAAGHELHHLIVPDRYREKALEGLRQFARTGTGNVVGKAVELTAWHRDKTEFPIELSISPVNVHGEWHATGIIRDITDRKQAEEKINKQSRLLDLIFAYSQESIVLLDKDYNFIKVSESYAKSCKRDVSEFAGHNHFEFYPSSLKDEFDEALSKNLIYSSTDRPFSFPEHPEWGTTYWDVGMVPIRDAENNVELLLFTLRDVTKRRQAEARVQKLARLYATLSQTNETIVRTTSREELFHNISERAVTHGKFIMAWVGLVDEATRMVRPFCHYGDEQGYLTDMVISTDDLPEGRGPTGVAIRENCISYVNDYVNDERVRPWREAALKRGYRGAAGLPLRFGNKVIGALTLYVDEPDFFDADQLKLLGEMVTDIGFALDNFAREAERKQAESKLAEQLDELRRWHDATLGREMRILDLKHEVNELLAQAGKPPRYHSAE